MGSCAVANSSIWNQWSIRVNVEQPTSSAARAVAARVGARASGPPGSVKLAKWIPSSMPITLRAQFVGGVGVRCREDDDLVDNELDGEECAGHAQVCRR